MANDVVVGRVKCDDCGEVIALKESKKGYAYYSCANCGNQHFTRSKDSDSRLRARMINKNEEVKHDSKETNDTSPAATGQHRKRSIW